MAWLQRWNFIERARLERQLWDAFQRGEDIEALVEACRREAAQGDGSRRFRAEVWETTLRRIRRIEALMREQGPSDGKGPR